MVVQAGNYAKRSPTPTPLPELRAAQGPPAIAGQAGTQPKMTWTTYHTYKYIVSLHKA